MLFDGAVPVLAFRGADGPGPTLQISLNFEEIRLVEGGCDAPGTVLLTAGPGQGWIYTDQGVQTEYTGARGLLIPTVY